MPLVITVAPAGGSGGGGGGTAGTPRCTRAVGPVPAALRTATSMSSAPPPVQNELPAHGTVNRYGCWPMGWPDDWFGLVAKLPVTVASYPDGALPLAAAASQLTS